jgi:hypothetical protein
MVKHACIAVVVTQLIFWCACSSDAAPKPTGVTFYETRLRSDHLKLRQWLWQCWSARRVATATVKWTTMEGDSGTSDYSIAKGDDGVWYLSVHLQGSERPMFESDTTHWRDDWTVAFSVQRVEEPYQRDWPGKPISHSRPLSARQFSLELKDKQGKILTRI